MGIDIYLQWEGQTPEEKKAQITGFNVTAGAAGYLREAYGGRPYATKVLLPESFEDACFEFEPSGMAITVEGGDVEEGRPFITLKTLKDRLPAAQAASAERYEGSPELVPHVQESFAAFVALAEQKALEGRKVLVLNSY